MSINLANVPLPAAIEPLSFERVVTDIQADLSQRFPSVAPSLQLESALVNKLIQAVAYRETLMRSRVNDAVRAVLAPTARGGDLDNVAARQGVVRLEIAPATPTAPAVLESDEALLRRYLLSFERASAGSRNRYLYEAWTAWPQMHDAKVNGWREHGRPGDVDIVIIGPEGRLATEPEKASVRAAVTAPGVQQETASVTVINAERIEFGVHVAIETPPGPDAEIIRQEVEARIRAAASVRMAIGGEIPPGLVAGAAYGANVLRVEDLSPVTIAPDPYAIPVMTSCVVTAEVRT